MTEGSKEAVAEKGNDLDAEGSLEFICPGVFGEVHSLKLTLSNAPKNGWLEYDPFLLGFGLFSGANC